MKVSPTGNTSSWIRRSRNRPMESWERSCSGICNKGAIRIKGPLPPSPSDRDRSKSTTGIKTVARHFSRPISATPMLRPETSVPPPWEKYGVNRLERQRLPSRGIRLLGFTEAPARDIPPVGPRSSGFDERGAAFRCLVRSHRGSKWQGPNSHPGYLENNCVPGS